MNYHGRMLEVLLQRERLLIQCQMQRMDLTDIARQSQGAIKVIDRVIGVVNYFRIHPMALGVVVASLAVIQRRSWWGWVRRAFMLWQAYRGFRTSRLRPKA